MTRLNEFVIANSYGFPKEGELVDGHRVTASGVDIESGRWFVIFDGAVEKATVQKALKPALGHTKYFTAHGSVYEVATSKKVKMETPRSNPTGATQTVVSGGITATHVRKNPVSVSEFRSEMRDMFVSDPRRDFKVIDSPKAHSAAFRDILFSFVSYRGESYGWVKGGKIYHRRGSLIMPKLKVNRAVEGSTVFYHTHPSKDEPSLSSADDYQFYLDLAFAFGIKHFYTVMENRIDHFEFTVKKSNEEDYLKMDEDKLLDDINSIIDGAEADISKKHKGDKNLPDEEFYSKMTAETVKRFNKRFKDYVTVKYSGQARPGIVRDNPSDAGFLHNPPIRISHIHKASQLEELRDTTNNFEHYGANEYGHSHYVYWWVDHHFSLTPLHPHGRLFKLKDLGLTDETRRKLRDYMSEEVAPGYSHLDILLLLALYHDVGKVREQQSDLHHSVIASEMFQNEIGPELGLPPEITDVCALLMLTDCGRRDITPEAFITQAGDYLPVAYMLQMADMLAHHPFMFSSRASEAKKEGLIDKANVEEYKKKIARDHFSNIARFLDERVKVNPPPTVSYIVATGSYETAIDGDIADEFFGEDWENPKASPMYYNGQLRLRDPESGLTFAVDVKNGNFRMYLREDAFSPDDEYGLARAKDIYTRVGKILSEFTPGIRLEDVPEPDILVNPRHSKNVHVITISGPSGVGKSTIARTLAMELDAALIPTVTTRPRRPREKLDGDRVFVSMTKFKEMIDAGDFVEWKRLKNGHYYGRQISDFSKPIAIVDVSLKGMQKYRNAFPNTTTIFLDPDVTPDQLAKRILKRGGMTKEEAKARARIASKQIADAHEMDFDMYVTTKTGKFEEVAKQIADDIVLNNPTYGQSYNQALRQNLLFQQGQKVTLDTFLPKNLFRKPSALSKVRVAYKDNEWIVVEINGIGPLASYSNMFRDKSHRLSTANAGWKMSQEQRMEEGSNYSYARDLPIYFIGKADKVWPIMDNEADGYGLIGPRTKRHYPAGEFRNGRNAEVGVKGHFDKIGRNIPERLYEILEKVADESPLGPKGDEALRDHVKHLRTETPEYRTANGMDRKGFVRKEGSPENRGWDPSDSPPPPDYVAHAEEKKRIAAEEEERIRKQEAAQKYMESHSRLVGDVWVRDPPKPKPRRQYVIPMEERRWARDKQRSGLVWTDQGWVPREEVDRDPRYNPPIKDIIRENDQQVVDFYKNKVRLVSPLVQYKQRVMGVFEVPVVEKNHQTGELANKGSVRLLFYSRTGTGSEGDTKEEDMERASHYWRQYKQYEKEGKPKGRLELVAESPFIRKIVGEKHGDAFGMTFDPTMYAVIFGEASDDRFHWYDKYGRKVGGKGWFIKPSYSVNPTHPAHHTANTVPIFPSTDWEEDYSRRFGHRTMFYAGVAIAQMIPDPFNDPRMVPYHTLRKQFTSDGMNFDVNVFMAHHNACLEKGEWEKLQVRANPKSRQEWFEDWAKLINMKNKELEAFLESPLGKKAGLSASEAKAQGIHSGRVSGKAILRMRKKIGLGGPKDYIKGPVHAKAVFQKAKRKWNDNDWEWCARQVRFNKRFMGDWMGKRKGPLVRDGQPTRRLLALWVWGFDPWRYARKVEKRKTMPKCPKVPWIGMTEKRMYGVQKNEVRMNPPVVVKSRKDDDIVSRFINPDTGEELTGRWFDGGIIDTTQGSRPIATLGQEITDVEQLGVIRGGREVFNVAKWGDRTVIEMIGPSTYTEYVEIDTPVFLLSNPTRQREPSAWFATVGETILSKKYTTTEPGEITDFKGVAKGKRPAIVYESVRVSPLLVNPQTSLPGLGEPAEDPAEIAPHLDWPMWNAPVWLPQNLIPADAVFVRPQRGEPYYHIRQQDLDTLLTSQEYLQAQEAHRQQVLREAQERREELERQGQKFIDDYRTNPEWQPYVGDPSWIHVSAVLIYKGKHRTWDNGKQGIEAGDIVKVKSISRDPRMPLTVITMEPVKSFNMTRPKGFPSGMVERDFEPAPSSFEDVLPDHLVNPALSAGRPQVRFEEGERIRFLGTGNQNFEHLGVYQIKQQTGYIANQRAFHILGITFPVGEIFIKNKFEHVASSLEETLPDHLVNPPPAFNKWAEFEYEGSEQPVGITLRIGQLVQIVDVRPGPTVPSYLLGHPWKSGNNTGYTPIGWVSEGFLVKNFRQKDAPSMEDSLPDHLVNPPNIPFPIPEEYQGRLEKQLANEMTQDGYRPLRVQQDFIDSGGYDDQPSDWSYVQGEYQEFLDEIEAQDWDEAYAEYSDVEGHTAYFLWTNYGIDMPVYTHGHIDKVLFRIRVFEDLFKHYGYEFGPEFLKGGSNYEKVFKVRTALDAAADAQGKPRVKDSDEQLSAVVRSVVEARKNPAPNNLSRDFERMKEMAYDVRSKELGGGFNGREWWNQQIPQIEARYGTEPLEARWLIPLDTTGFDPSDKSQEFDDDGVKPLHFLNQIKRIPMTKPPTPERIMQVALNIGQGQVHGIIPEDYGLGDFIAFNNPPSRSLKIPTEKVHDYYSEALPRALLMKTNVRTRMGQSMEEIEGKMFPDMQYEAYTVARGDLLFFEQYRPLVAQTKEYLERVHGVGIEVVFVQEENNEINAQRYGQWSPIGNIYFREMGDDFGGDDPFEPGLPIKETPFVSFDSSFMDTMANPRKITPSYVRNHPTTLFVFGDNDQRRGKGGQAVIRDEPNAIGLRTKKAPRTSASAYYTDEEYQENVSKMQADLDEISRRSVDYEKVHFIPGIGEGLAKLKEKAPRTYSWMKKNLPSNNPRTPGGKKFPTRYLTGLTALERMIAEDEIDKGYEYDADDPKAYEFWKSDIKATARGMKIGSSKHREEYYRRYRKNIDKDYKPSGKSQKDKFLNRIRKETGIKKSILEKVYDKGLAAWRVGHRPGVQQHQWAAGRVYAFAVGADSSTGPGKPDHKLAVEAGVRKK